MRPYREQADVAPEPRIAPSWQGRFARAEPDDEDEVGPPVGLPVRDDAPDPTDVEVWTVRIGTAVLALMGITMMVLQLWHRR